VISRVYRIVLRARADFKRFHIVSRNQRQGGGNRRRFSVWLIGSEQVD